ncbi:hypothetical protein K2Q02_01195 [Patescibacteria group bacterium]|nr:hypothetical protein [Patescibacteria group bacterium]
MLSQIYLHVALVVTQMVQDVPVVQVQHVMVLRGVDLVVIPVLILEAIALVVQVAIVVTVAGVVVPELVAVMRVAVLALVIQRAEVTAVVINEKLRGIRNSVCTNHFSIKKTSIEHSFSLYCF